MKRSSALLSVLTVASVFLLGFGFNERRARADYFQHQTVSVGGVHFVLTNAGYIYDYDGNLVIPPSLITDGLSVSRNDYWQFSGVWAEGQDGHLYLYYTHDYSHNVWNWFDAGNPGSICGGRGFTRPAGAGYGTASDPGYLGAIVKCGDGTIAEFNWNGSRWGWRNWGKPSPTVTAYDYPALASTSGYTVAAVRGTDGHLWILRINPASGWYDLGAPAGFGAFAGSPGAAFYDHDQLDVFISDSQGNAWIGYHSMAYGYSGWHNFGFPANCSFYGSPFSAVSDETNGGLNIAGYARCNNGYGYSRLLWRKDIRNWSWGTEGVESIRFDDNPFAFGEGTGSNFEMGAIDHSYQYNWVTMDWALAPFSTFAFGNTEPQVGLQVPPPQ